MSNRLFAINILLRTCPLMIDLEYAMDIYDSFFCNIISTLAQSLYVRFT